MVPSAGRVIHHLACLGFAGKFTESNLPKGPRGAIINKERVAEVQPLLGLMRDIGSAHGGKTPGQVIYSAPWLAEYA